MPSSSVSDRAGEPDTPGAALAREGARRTHVGHWLLAASAAAVVMALASQLELSWLSPRAGFTVAFGAVSAETLLVASVAPIARARWALLSVLLSACAAVGLHGAAPSALSGALLTLALLLGGSALGAALGARIEHAAHLLAVALVSGLADMWSAQAGPTARMVESAIAAPERLALFALPWPLWGTGSIQPVLGVGDVVFVALYMAAFRRHGLSLTRAWRGMGAGLALGLLSLLVFERAVPLLPMIGAGAVLSDRRARALERRERVMVWAVTAVLAGVLVTRWWR